MLAAERAMLIKLESVRSVLLFFHCVVVSALAFCANECDFCSHIFRPPMLFCLPDKPLRLRGNFNFSRTSSFSCLLKKDTKNKPFTGSFDCTTKYTYKSRVFLKIILIRTFPYKADNIFPSRQEDPHAFRVLLSHRFQAL